MAQFDISAVAPEDATWQASSVTNPADAWLTGSYEAGDGTKLGAPRQVKVPASQVKTIVNMLHGASRNTGLGVSIRVRVGNDEFAVSKDLYESLTSLKDRSVIVKFRAKVKSLRPRKAVIAAVEVGTPAAVPADPAK
jgi:hypothetical protein